VKTNLLATPVRPTASTCFRLFLQAELGRRCAGNTQYSLRAFAKYLAIDHATLSQLLRGKRPLTPRTILKLGTRLGLERAAIDLYVAHEAFWGREPGLEATLNEVQELANDTVNVISDWYHYAILELTRLQDFKPDSRWIARALGITADGRGWTAASGQRHHRHPAWSACTSRWMTSTPS
jgi:transcriptional regulator with XRE-family HTH domain